jgi:hypothetical protein
MSINFDSTSQCHNSDNNRKCSICYSETSYSEKTKWGVYEHWYGTREYPICKRCYIRKKYQEKFVPVGVKCDCAKTDNEPTVFAKIEKQAGPKLKYVKL